jgi:hypothetical protein
VELPATPVGLWPSLLGIFTNINNAPARYRAACGELKVRHVISQSALREDSLTRTYANPTQPAKLLQPPLAFIKLARSVGRPLWSMPRPALCTRGVSS